MKASETKFQPIIEGTLQYVVPLYQRKYSWGENEWRQLWSDLTDLTELIDADDKKDVRDHFIGSIVTMPIMSVPEGVAKYLLIDGQQRLTTIFIILILTRDLIRKDNDPDNDELAREIEETKLINRFKKGNDYFKLLPTQKDRAAFTDLINGNPTDANSNILKCYHFFETRIRQSRSDLSKLSTVITNRLSVVSITLSPDDNPHRVFESLNAKGLHLTEADLIRNALFMRIHPDQHDGINTTYWLPMQEALGDDLTEFIRHYLMLNGSYIRRADIYPESKKMIDREGAEATLKRLSRYATYYHRLLDPSTEPNPRVREGLLRNKRLEQTTTYPFLLNCYADYAEEDRPRLSAVQLVEVLQTLENFLIRRFICDIPSNALNKIMPELYRRARVESNTDFISAVQSDLQRSRYPKDSEFADRLRQVRLYGRGDRLEKTNLILESLEASYGHKETVDLEPLTVEHVMPQRLSDEWRLELGEDWQENHELLLHTLGNLTLTGYNSELSNSPFKRKQAALVNSHLELNKYFAQVPRWDGEAIEARSQSLAERCLNIWPYFGEKPNGDAVTLDTVTGRTPVAVVLLNQQYPVKSWRDVMTVTLNGITDLVPEQFEKLAQQFQRMISKDQSRFRTSRELKNGYFVDTNVSARNCYRFCQQAIQEIDLSGDDWRVTVE